MFQFKTQDRDLLKTMVPVVSTELTADNNPMNAHKLFLHKIEK